MTENPCLDAFNICWKAIFLESEKNNCAFFNKTHCKIQDSRDYDCDVVENRMAFTYKFGCFNILFFEKCFSNFLNECSTFEAVFPLENLKVCSLSNGPGFDIIGLLCALYQSNKALKNFPVLNAINIYETWSNLYKTIVRRAYEMISFKSFIDYFHINSDSINLIKGDIYSSLSAETKNCITNSNVLLMVKVFVSSKANPGVFSNTLKEIFSLLQPGSLVFFIGSKNNIKQFSKYNLNRYVKCIYGPENVTLDKVPIDESFSSAIGIKPLDSGYAQFIVWQKNELVAEKTKRSRRKKNKNLKITSDEKVNENAIEKPLNEDVVNESNNDSDAESELSYTSESKQSDILTDKKSDSYSDEFYSANHSEVKSEVSQMSLCSSLKNSSYSEDTASLLDKVKPKNLNYEEQREIQQNIVQSDNDNASKLVNETQENFDSNSLETNIFVRDAISLAHDFYENYPASYYVNKNTSAQVLKENAQENNVKLDFKYANVGSANNLSNTKFPPITGNTGDATASKSACKKKTKMNKIQDVSEIKNKPSPINLKDEDQKYQKILETYASETHKIYDNSINPEREMVVPQVSNVKDLNYTDKPNLQSLIQRCENLVTAVEKLTIGIKNDIVSSKSDQRLNGKHHCTVQPKRNYEVFHHCCCCIKVVPSCCCRKNCRS